MKAKSIRSNYFCSLKTSKTHYRNNPALKSIRIKFSQASKTKFLGPSVWQPGPSPARILFFKPKSVTVHTNKLL